ncbi:hypothetical protein LQ327_00325 [Actinomycetospora endophytica]|uniref:Uncharacterized protein n=2 Tax=Actinomycetospora endophytica TaxID=2291215 RepID=A0ABS8P0R8_9PSEU|nr:hypothetical protein [Actinomycetospora endophytica]
MATWAEVAFGQGLTLLVPSLARDEVLLARPEQSDLVDVCCSPALRHRPPERE